MQTIKKILGVEVRITIDEGEFYKFSRAEFQIEQAHIRYFASRVEMPFYKHNDLFWWEPDHQIASPFCIRDQESYADIEALVKAFLLKIDESHFKLPSKNLTAEQVRCAVIKAASDLEIKADLQELCFELTHNLGLIDTH